MSISSCAERPTMYAIKENAEGLCGGTGKGGELKLAASFFVFFQCFISVSYGYDKFVS